MLFFRKSDDAVADVAGRKNAEFFAQGAGASTLVGDGHDCAEARDRPRPLGVDVAFEAAQQSGEAGSPSDRDDVETRVSHRLSGCQVIRLSTLDNRTTRQRD